MCESVRRNINIRSTRSGNANTTAPTAAPARIVTGTGLLSRQVGGTWFIELDPNITTTQPTISIPIDTNNIEEIIGPTAPTEAAEPDAWDRDENVFNRSIKVTLQTRTVYDASGDQTLYAFVRDLVFDRTGKLASVSAERRITVAATESC